MIYPAQLEHGLVNLAVNARDAMPVGGTLSVTIANAALDADFTGGNEGAPPGDYVKLTVADTGTGMAPEVAEKALEAFFTTKEVGEGSGLGLPIFYGFVKQSGGYISIDSAVGIDIYLPRSTHAVPELEAETEAREFALGSERILVIEDDASVREVPVGILRRQGYDIVEAEDGTEAMRHLQSDQSFDWVFTNVVLPGGLNGVEIANQARRMRPGIKILYTSGYAEDAVLHDGQIGLGVNLLSKPYHRAQLLDMVRAALDSEQE